MCREPFDYKGITRREFLRKVVRGVAAGALVNFVGVKAFASAENTSGTAAAVPAQQGMSEVVIARIPKISPPRRTSPQASKLDLPTARSLLEKSILSLTKEKNARDAWWHLLQPKPKDIVGIKIGCLGGPNLCTSRELVRAVIEHLKAIGIAENSIVIWDRRDDELRKCGYELNSGTSGVRCYGTLPNRGYTDEVKKVAGKEIRLSAILEKEIRVLINMPVLKDHNVCGITAAMKNHFGSFNVPWELHGNNGDPYIAAINGLPVIREKTKVIICDAFCPVCQGGPSDHPRYRWNYGGLLVSTDPVALDLTGWQIIEERRRVMGLHSLAEDGREPKYIATAGKFQLGVATASRIKALIVNL
jgi:uncharacterized protein (DUF362 family)